MHRNRWDESWTSHPIGVEERRWSCERRRQRSGNGNGTGGGREGRHASARAVHTGSAHGTCAVSLGGASHHALSTTSTGYEADDVSNRTHGIWKFQHAVFTSLQMTYFLPSVLRLSFCENIHQISFWNIVLVTLYP